MACRSRARSRASSTVCTPRLGGLRQETLRRTGARAPLPGPLHASGGHLQSRLLSMEDGKVTFRWKDYAHGGKKRKMTLAAEEFIRRFLLHVLPKGFVRIRHYGWMANRCRRESSALCRALLGAEVVPAAMLPDPAPAPFRPCPFCGGAVEVIEMIVPRELSRYRQCRKRELDTS